MKTTKTTSRTALSLATALIAGTALHAAPVIDEPFADSDSTLAGNTPGTGLTGTYSTTGTYPVSAPSLFYGNMASSGNHASAPTGNVGFGVSIDPVAFDLGGGASLLDGGDELWFSMIVNTPAVGGSNADTGFAIGTDRIPTNAMQGTIGTGKTAIGWTIKNDKLQASIWNEGTSVRGTNGPSVSRNTKYLILGRINWGATSGDADTVELWLPDETLSFDVGTPDASVTAVVADQSAYDTISHGQKTNTDFAIDEIRYGATSADVLVADTTAPTVVSIEDNVGGGPIAEDIVAITYTVTFDQAINGSSIDPTTEITNGGTATIDTASTTVTQVGTNVLEIQLFISGSPVVGETLILEFPSTAVISDWGGQNLDVTTSVQDDTTITIASASSPYDTWAAGPWSATLTDSDPSLDFDGGGLETGLEWVLGGDPTLTSDDAGIAPTVSEDATYLVFTYNRSDAANDDPNTTIAVEYGSDLTGWTTAVNTVDGVIVTETPGTPADVVEVKIPKALAVGAKLFARLKVVVNTP